jgi:hypothetical protein
VTTAVAIQKPAPIEATMKGIGFDNVRAFVKGSYGDRSWAQLLDAMSPSDRATLHSVIAVGWYEVKLFARLLRKLDQTFGKGDSSLLHAVGAYEAEQDFGRALRLLLRVVAPSQVFRAERRLWRHFQDSGEWVFSAIDGGMRGVLTGWEVDEALCVELSGYLVRLVEFTGGTNVTVDHVECRDRRHAACIFDFRWT